jgi:MFS family permease
MEQVKALTENVGKGSYRWIILILISIVIGSNYYVYDAMSSIKSVLQAQLGFSSTEYGLIISFYAWPNTFFLMAIIGGIILDKWGIKKTGIMFISFCTLGAFLTAYGASDAYMSGGIGYDFFGSFLKDYSPELKMMIIGRLFFGLGAETSIVVINKILVKWFKGKELAFAFGLNLAIARLGTAMALIFSPELIESDSNIGNALWVATVLMGTGLTFFFIYLFFDKKFSKKSEEVKMADEEKFRISDIFKIIQNKSFIYICLLCVIFYSAVFPFLSYCPDLLFNKFDVSREASGVITSIIIFGTILFTPLFGFIIDKHGKRATLMLLGSGMLFIIHFSLALTYLTPYIAMFLLGVAFSLVPAAMWPAVTQIVKENRLGTAYGLMFSVQNLGLFAFPTLAGYVLDKTNPGVTPQMIADGLATYDYTYTMLMFASLGVIGFVFALLLKRESSVSNINLEKGSENL